MKYRPLLFADTCRALLWKGNIKMVRSVMLPFLMIERVDALRTEQPGDANAMAVQHRDPFSTDLRGRELKGWMNKLIWGDTPLILSSLNKGPQREPIEAHGGLTLIDSDTPFDLEADCSIGASPQIHPSRCVQHASHQQTPGCIPRHGRYQSHAPLQKHLRLDSTQ
ncbi:MAG: hypothetical protein VKO39_04600 [Cyanobacteriota bacterium]|nr:hypothetical protein [Cyanobacteriota bacterium]